MLETVTFYREAEFEPPTVTVHVNGLAQVTTPFEDQQHARVYLPGGTADQLEAVRKLPAIAVRANPVVRFMFKAGTLPCPLLELMRELRNA
jgi:hypothetical protein